MAENNVLKQDLNNEAKYSGVYMMWLLFREKCGEPSVEAVLGELEKRFGQVDVVSGTGLRSFALPGHTVTYKEGQKVPSQVIMDECSEVAKPHGDSIARSQFWDCAEGVELLDSCGYQVMIGDFMAGGLPALERAEILADWLEIGLRLYPDCAAVYAESSGKLMTAESLRNNPYTGARRFIWFGVNARFFNIEGTRDILVDTLGLYAVGLPDVQYHFCGADANEVVNHAYNTAVYQFENDAPIKDGDTIEGILPGSKWKCRYERALVQPVRDVLDVEMGEFAAGKRG